MSKKGGGTDLCVPLSPPQTETLVHVRVRVGGGKTKIKLTQPNANNMVAVLFLQCPRAPKSGSSIENIQWKPIFSGKLSAWYREGLKKKNVIKIFQSLSGPTLQI
jgi:hypothetical protein